jgi:RNA polymerase sigma-70 factor, ECF subfamily
MPPENCEAGDTRTSNTLLLRLKDLGDPDAWDDFVERYTPRIFTWCRHCRLQESDAADVTQDVLVKLVTAMRTFEYDPVRGSFRGWLKTVTNNAVRDLARSLARPDAVCGRGLSLDQLSILQTPEALDALAASIQEEGERELLREAESRVRLRVMPRTWEAYRLTAIESMTAAVAAEVLPMTVAEVYVAKSRVIKMLRAEVDTLNHLPSGVQ